jgi:putative membrane protein
VRKLAGIAGLGLLVAGCGGNPSTEPYPPAQRSKPPVVRSISISPAQYVATASSASLYVIKSSQLIAEREGDTGIGNFARQFAAEQEGVGSQLSFAGRRLNLLPAAALSPTHQAMLNALSASPDPTGTYISQLSTLLRQTATFHRQYERYGTSPTLRPVASMAGSVFERELSQLRGFRASN